MAKIMRQTLREQVTQAIRLKLLSGQLRPGERIVEQEMAEDLGVSRGPVREALRQIEQEGLVEYTSHVGCFEQFDEVIENDNQFHACIIEECGLKRLYTLWSSMDSGNTIVFYRGAGKNEYVVHNQEKIHRRVLDAVKTGDVQVICKTLIDHYTETTIGYLKDHGISTEEFPYKINVNF